MLTWSSLLGQGKSYAGPDDPAADPAAERSGKMEGNNVYLFFRNTTELSDWPAPNVSLWPNNASGVKMLDGVGLLVAAKVYILSDHDDLTVDTIPVTDPIQIITQASDLHTLYYLQTSYREEMDKDPTGTVEWGFYPVFGYFNDNVVDNKNPAMSGKPNSWPDYWPATGNTTKWPGEWDGRFGRGIIYADEETYFVVNDAQDQEYLGPEDRVKYFPRPGVKIGDKRPQVTKQGGKPWGGIGLRVETRGFQWNNPQSQDAIFWEYTIANISDYDLTEVAFGYWVDNAIGDDGSDELGFFDNLLDLAYTWDKNGIGLGGRATGTMGFAYLESPGLGYDDKDNDDDGLLNELRDNDPGELIDPYNNPYMVSMEDYLKFYRLTEEDLVDHFEGDEDGDWEDGNDANGDGIYQINEFAGDDVGLDGVGPGELNYFGPDEGECNHRPDYQEGVGCEPNFNDTDVSESDMVGLTSFRLFPVPSHSASTTTWWFRNDRAMWNITADDSLEEYIGNISNLIETFASGTFPLYQGRTERISMSELHSYDPLSGLESESHSAPALYQLKSIVQVIYEKDYRFAQPPLMPTLTATPGDGQVILTWDNLSDTRTRDPFVGNINDFEGYKLFRATDKWMGDPKVITDGFGTPTYSEPLFYCDLIDEIQGFTDFGLINGVAYFLGTETGLKHHFIDTDVENGRTYYYGLSAYDYGAPDIGPGIAPSFNNVVIRKDDAQRHVIGIGKNVAIVTPYPRAAGFRSPELDIPKQTTLGSGKVKPIILAQGGLKDGHEYVVTFDVDTLDVVSNYPYGLTYVNDGFRITDLTAATQVYHDSPAQYTGANLLERDSLNYWTLNPNRKISTDVFDGVQVIIDSIYETPEFELIFDSELGYNLGDWLVDSDYRNLMKVIPTMTESKYLAWDYLILWQGDSSYTGLMPYSNKIRDENHSRLSSGEVLTNQSFPFVVINQSLTDPSGNPLIMDMLVHDMPDTGDTLNGSFELDNDRILVGAPGTDGRWAGTAFVISFPGFEESSLPQSGDQYLVSFNRPFFATDTIKFTVHKQDSLDADSLREKMKEIMVVPNPYIATNMMESSEVVGNRFINQGRRLMFTNVPAQSTIKIFTVSGVFVDEIHVDYVNPPPDAHKLDPLNYQLGDPSTPDRGVIHWDMLTREGLEIAAGMYIFHVKSEVTGDEAMGKFAVIK